MFHGRTRTSAAAALVAAGLALEPLPASAQDVQRIEITGSSLRRIDAEAALPVQVLRRDDIERLGATSTADLLQKLPAVQSSTGESVSVGAQSFGFSGVSIHGLTQERTLVLLNGHRLASFGGQAITGSLGAVDVNAIPLAAIDRIEILTDGASAIYGADAIAGVVNVITRRDTTAGDVTVGYSHPEQGGARERRASATKGFGSLGEDGYNVLFSIAHDERTKLAAVQRDFAKTGSIVFRHRGNDYRFQAQSPAAIPANVVDDQGQLVSPWRILNGSCPERTFEVVEPFGDGVDHYCGFDFVGELEIYPVRRRDSFLGSFNKSLGPDHTLFADVLYSRNRNVSRIAAVPGNVAVAAGTPLHDQYVLPAGITSDTIAVYRIDDLGKRTSDDTATFVDVAAGSNGRFGAWDYAATYAHSESRAKARISGYPGALAIARLADSGNLNPFVPPGQQTPEGMAALAGVNYEGYWDGGRSVLDTVSLRLSRELFTLAAGPVQLGTGVSVGRERFEARPSLFAQGLLADPVAGTRCDPVGDPGGCDQRFGDAAATPPFSASRRSWAAFGELLIPARESLELTTALRHDHYADFGGATTAKAAFKWRPSRSWMVRGSVGTGFHAPTVAQVEASLRPFGATFGAYSCTPELQQLAQSLGAQCRPGAANYNVVAGGNRGLKPEKSRQASLGLRFEPTPAMSLGADLWHVAIRDTFGQLSEEEVFANPRSYPNAWTTARDVGTGQTFLAFLADVQNLGKAYFTGVDFDLSGRLQTRLGRLTSRVIATYVLRHEQQLQENGPYFSTIANNAELGFVTFRWQGRWLNTLSHGNWAHTLALNFRSGYTDQEVTAERLDADGTVAGTESIRLDVDPYWTVDWQTRWAFRRSFQLAFGALNLLDEDPPLSLAVSGLNKGQQFGYDDRYYDPRGRTWYVDLSYEF